MNFKETGSKRHKDTGKLAVQNELKSFDTSAMVWHLIVRHKFTILAFYALGLTAYFVFPPIIDVLGLFGRL